MLAPVFDFLEVTTMFDVSNFCTKRELAVLLGFSPHTLKSIRKKFWSEGVHFVAPTARTVRYHRRLCIHWLATRNSPEIHQKAIEDYLRELEQDKSP